MHSFQDLAQLSKGQIRTRFGGKSLGLYEAYQLGISIPETWLVDIDNYVEFIHKNPNLTHNQFKKKAVEFLSLRFSKELSIFDESIKYAVRSSSQVEDAFDHSFAGIFESRLEIERKDLLNAVADVWDSCSSLRASSYADEKQTLKMAVIIQPMVVAKFAGVCFSKHPSPASVLENAHIVIEFAAASGEKVVQGEVTPIRLSGDMDTLLSTTDAPWMHSLLGSVLALKKAHCHEIDIEFVIDQKENFWLVQQRPISKMHASHVLDLSSYKKQYKRSLGCLDVELLIDGCSKFLTAYLEVPYRFDQWMVMITSLDGQQELWTHELLNQAVIYKISQKIIDEEAFLNRICERYFLHHRKILEMDYARFFDPKESLDKRFFAWLEFMTPLCAHYYVPMFIIDALHLILKQHMEEIDDKLAERDLFFLGTFGIASLMDILKQELMRIKTGIINQHVPFEELDLHDQTQLKDLSARLGFLKCHQVYEEGYSANELYGLLKDLKENKDESREQEEAFERILEKYINSEESKILLDQFRNWMKIRNQDMEYLLYAIVASRPLFEEIADTLQLSVRQLWYASKEIIFKAIQLKKPALISHFSRENVVIFRSYGKVRVMHDLKLTGLSPKNFKGLKGKTVFGAGCLKAKVRIAFKPQDLIQMQFEQEPYVLVTGMTTPDFIPHIKNRFSALVTDEGGILCHAAIVAREIPIPSIVGTAVATELLKNDMLVQLDFDRGEIEIIAPL